MESLLKRSTERINEYSYEIAKGLEKNLTSLIFCSSNLDELIKIQEYFEITYSSTINPNSNNNSNLLRKGLF